MENQAFTSRSYTLRQSLLIRVDSLDDPKLQIEIKLRVIPYSSDSVQEERALSIVFAVGIDIDFRCRGAHAMLSILIFATIISEVISTRLSQASFEHL